MKEGEVQSGCGFSYGGGSWKQAGVGGGGAEYRRGGGALLECWSGSSQGSVEFLNAFLWMVQIRIGVSMMMRVTTCHPGH
jgi:hypothetical protein